MKTLATGRKPGAFWVFFFNVIIIITSFHSNVKEEEGEGRVESLLAQLFSAAQAVVVSAHGAFQRRSWKC